MSKDAMVYFDDILESIAQIEKYTNKITDKEFFKNVMFQLPGLKKSVDQIVGEIGNKQDSKNS